MFNPSITLPIEVTRIVIPMALFIAVSVSNLSAEWPQTSNDRMEIEIEGWLPKRGLNGHVEWVLTSETVPPGSNAKFAQYPMRIPSSRREAMRVIDKNPGQKVIVTGLLFIPKGQNTNECAILAVKVRKAPHQTPSPAKPNPPVRVKPNEDDQSPGRS